MNNLAITYQYIADILSFEVPNAELKKTLCQPSFDWDSIVKEGSKHYIIPALYCRLKAKELLDLLPEELIHYLEFITDENRKRNTIILEQIHTISKLLNSKDIEHVFLKGAALLASNCFDDIAERMLGDIDLIVAPDQTHEAHTLLCNNNYSPSYQTLGNDFFAHKHLPRLETEITSTRIAAVEVHEKLFMDYNYEALNFETLFNEKRQHNGLFIPSKKHLLMHNILNFQINDYGALYHSISFRSAYDTIILQKTYSGPKNWYKTQPFKNYFRYVSLFFKDIKWSSSSKTKLFTKFYLFKLRHVTFYKNWNKLVKLRRLTPIFFSRTWLFVSNKAYRTAIIEDRNRIYSHFKSIFSNF
ncbi:MAG: nucleotidyltransferase family protein [Winogradskyella sp.]|uniref:nucleotidyltransferase family protein n=1 Tax=Winogradskyella sp. TaxID=1883156 RepID=UPI0038597E7F